MKAWETRKGSHCLPRQADRCVLRFQSAMTTQRGTSGSPEDRADMAKRILKYSPCYMCRALSPNGSYHWPGG